MSFPKKIKSNLTRSLSSAGGSKESKSAKLKHQRQRPKSSIHYSSDEGYECDSNYENNTSSPSNKVRKSHSFKSVNERNNHRFFKKMDRDSNSDKYSPPRERRRKRSNTIGLLLEYHDTVRI